MSLVDRQWLMEEAGEQLEQRFELAGATAIEDKLQEGVPETVDKLRRAGVKVWMLTGDKRETAINIAHSARLCRPFSELYVLDGAGPALGEALMVTLNDVCRGMVPYSVVDGQTLAVGDGTNDIGMIQASHVGVGISGREGLQAARIADYSVAQFRFLQRLLLVHRRWNYLRTGKYVLATFWK